MSASAEELETLQNELNALRLEKEKESQKEKDVMRGLVAKIQALTNENKQLQDITKIEQSPVSTSTNTINSNVNTTNDDINSKADSTMQHDTENVHIESKVTLEIENSTLRSELSKMQAQLLELQDELNTTRSVNEELNNRYRNMEQSSNGQVKDLEGLAEQQRSTIQDLETELIALREENNQYKIATSDDSARATQAKEDSEMKITIEDLSAQVTLKDRELHSLQSDLSELKKSQAESEERGKKYIAVLNKTKKQILKLEKEKAEAAEELSLFKTALSDTKEDLAQALKRLAERDSEVATQASRITQQQSEITNSLRERKEANEALMELRDELQLKQAEYESSQSHVEDLEMKVRESERQLDELNDKIAALDEQLSNSEARRERLQENEKLLIQRNADQISGMQQKLETVSNGAKAEKDKLEHMKTVFEKKAAEDSADIDKLKNDLDSAMSQSQEMLKLASQRTDEVKFAQRQKEELATALTKAQDNSKLLSSKVENLTEELNQLKNWAAAIRKEKEDIEKQLEESKVKEMHVKSLNKTLKEEIKKVTRATPVSQVAFSPSSSRSSSPITKVSSPPGTYGMQEDLSTRTKIVNADSNGTQSSAKTPLNMEYLKHVVIGFMENKQARTQLIPVLSMLLQLSPEDIKRLQTAG
ncbi:hypothetical protein INT44_005380 [Umbelopsis vinacea]|uniref:GRIP domain-containing protein n=1 Tax=Umbelopsis vinacea TaxID=44442 RepID=A0A8H7Q8V7_9FUNG|nr:hypothetical protein INT44_005380 [Umbelopsis vinacea]